MSKMCVFAALLLLVTAGAAKAGGQAGTIGVGAEFQLGGPGGPSVNYDAGKWHAGGFLGFGDRDDNRDADFMVGGQFYYHLHSTAMSDLGIGGSLGLASIGGVNQGNMTTDRATRIYLEPGIQIRVFLATNVAFSASTGVAIVRGDGSNDVALTGSTIGAGTVSIGNNNVGLSGGLGLHYYFF